jgi:hypothetical protein
MKTTRQTFVVGSLGVCAAGLLSGCGGDDADPEENDAAGDGCDSEIGTNHGHELNVSAADTTAATAKSYDIQGSSDHSHTVDLDSEDFADLADGTILILTSSTDAGHSHEVTITC